MEGLKLFNRRLKDLREDSDKTQEDLAKYLNVSRTTIANYELGYREPPYSLLIKVAEYFNVSTDYLLGRTNKRVPYTKIEKIIDHLPESE